MDNIEYKLLFIVFLMGILSGVYYIIFYLSKRNRTEKIGWISSILKKYFRGWEISTRVKAVIVLFNVVIMIVIFVLSSRGTQIEFHDNGILIRGMHGVFINFADISEAYLIPGTMSTVGGTGRRINGTEGAFNKRGFFEAGLVFVHVNSAPTIQIVREDRLNVYISFRQSSQTKEFYYEIRSIISTP